MPNPLSESRVLRVSSLSKQLVSTDRSFCLRVPHLEVEAGSVTVIIGRSGCGKSTLLDMLGLISVPTSAQEFAIFSPEKCWVEVAAASSACKEQLRRQALGYILQTGGLLPYLNVADNIALPLQLNKRHKLPVQELMERLGISDLRKQYPAQLSMGQRQRVAIARALVHRPSIVLADEPTGALDPETAGVVCRMLVNNARQSGAAVIIVTHDAELFRQDADRMYSFHLESCGKDVISTLYELKGAPA